MRAHRTEHAPPSGRGAALAVLLAATLGAVVPASAQEGGSRSVFAEGTGNRPLAMGGAYTALADDASGLLWNPGGLGRIPRLELEAGQTSYFSLGIHEGWAMGAYPSWRWGVFAATFRYLGVDDIEVRDDRNFLVGGPTADTQTEMTLGYGRRLGEAWSLGGAFKARHQSLAGFTASAFGLDAGLTGYPALALGIGPTWAGNLSWGLSFSNLVKPSLRLDRESVDDPSALRTGLAWRESFAGYRTVIVSADIEKPQSLDAAFHVGLEFQPFPQLALRTGVSGGTMTAGTGIHWHGMALDYAFENRPFDAVHRFGLSYAFGRTVDQSREAARRHEEDKLQARLNDAFQRRQAEQVDALVTRAGDLRATGDFEGAVDLLGTAATLDPARTDISPIIAACYRGEATRAEAAEDFAGAAIAYTRALAAAPGDSAAAAGHARCQAESDRRAARDAETQRLFAEALDAFGADDLPGARHRLQRVLELKPGDHDAAEMLHRTEEAIARRGRALMRDARQDVEGGRADDAAALLDQVATLDPTTEGLGAARLAVARARASAAPDTVSAPKAHVAPAPKPPTLSPRELDELYRRGLAAMQEHRSDDALRYWELVWSADPAYAQVVELLKREYLTRGMESFAAGRLEEAVGFWQRARRVDPSDPRAQGYIDRAQKQLSRTREILGNNN